MPTQSKELCDRVETYTVARLAAFLFDFTGRSLYCAEKMKCGQWEARYSETAAELYRKEYAEMLADRLDVNEEDADAILLAFLDILKETWNHGHAVCIKNFGVFELRTISSKIGRNPKTMEDHLIPESFKPSFRSTKGLREEITRSVREKRVAND